VRLSRKASPAPSGPTVLVADDDPVVREVLHRALTARGYSVIAVGDGTSAVAAAHEHSPQIALLDWLMPGLYGPDVCVALRAQPETAHIPLVLLTTQGEERDVAHGYRSGADEYLTKPFHPREVLAVVERLLAARDPG
jgi:DNA-binding response OmpR family regulator